jgi:hypothetical protein
MVVMMMMMMMMMMMRRRRMVVIMMMMMMRRRMVMMMMMRRRRMVMMMMMMMMMTYHNGVDGEVDEVLGLGLEVRQESHHHGDQTHDHLPPWRHHVTGQRRTLRLVTSTEENVRSFF